MIIKSVEKGSRADRYDMRPGDQLLTIAGHAVRDPIDFQFYAADDFIAVTLKRGEERICFTVDAQEETWFGVEFEEVTYRSCGNHCVFCFVDQNPKKLRDTLYFKDEDFRLSFLYGNYVTLTNMGLRDLKRIATQRLSPLYLSVHSSAWPVRKKLLGIRRDDHLLDKLAFLAKAGIEMHAQIVLCPGWNDGVHLDQTIDDLARFYPALQTIAIVPVGLTGHRRGLPRLVAVSAEYAAELIAWERMRCASFLRRWKTHFIYLADEFYLLAGQVLPRAKRYENFAQIENGVGMTRAFLDQFNRQKRWLPRQIAPKSITLVTGQMAAPVIQKQILPVLERIEGLSVQLIAIENRFYGGGVSVSGLLTGGDIATQLQGRALGELVVLPPNCLNHDGVFLDDWNLAQLEKVLQKPVFKPESNFAEILRIAKKI